MVDTRAPRRIAVRSALAAALLALVAGGCNIPPGSLDGPIAVILHVDTTPTTVDFRAENWYSDATAIYLCPAEPPPLPEPGPELVGWTPGPQCHDYGIRPSPNGLAASLPITELGAAQRPFFVESQEWYLLLLDLEGDRVSSAIRSAFAAPPLVDGP